jgi:hypothetical protein
MIANEILALYLIPKGFMVSFLRKTGSRPERYAVGVTTVGIFLTRAGTEMY